MHRRSFVKNSALLGSGMLVGNEVFGILNADKVINIAMIGCGDRGKGVLLSGQCLRNLKPLPIAIYLISD